MKNDKRFVHILEEIYMSKKILIVSDSHGNNTNLRKAIANMGDTLDLMIHLGDMECDPDVIKNLVKCPAEMVKGNCDGLSRLQAAKIIDIGEHKALITHGHRYGGKYGIDSMREMAEVNGADIVMFGHIHEPVLEHYQGGMTVLNPGSISKPRQDGHRPTYAVMTIEDDGRTDYAIVKM